MKLQEKRNVRGYKVKDNIYNKAQKRAIKEGSTLANILECVVIGYASGMKVYLNKDLGIPNVTSDFIDVIETLLLSKPLKVKK